MSLLLLFLSDEAATDDFCNLLTEDGGKLLTEAGEDIIGENCVPDAQPTPDFGARTRRTSALFYYLSDDEEVLFISDTL